MRSLHRHFFVLFTLALGFLLASGGAAAFGKSPALLTDIFVQRESAANTQNVESAVDRDAPEFVPGSVKEPLSIPTEGTAIHADLNAKVLSVYKEGSVERTFPILATGKPGSTYETPAGRYTIKTKEKSHFSSITKIWMPYSMHFYGNYFIHGWPHKDDGTLVNGAYSGGCIRLSTEDAEALFSIIDIGTPIVVTGVRDEVTAAPKGYYVRSSGVPIPRGISATAYAVADLTTGDVLLEEQGNAVLPIASVSKLFTVLTALDHLDHYKEITISQSAVDTEGVGGDLVPGDKLEVEEFVFPLLLESSNDAAVVLAEHVGERRFIDLMNIKVSSIGLKQTRFADSSGLSPGNTSTALDLIRLARYLYVSKQHVLGVTTLRTKSLPASESHHAYQWKNISQFLDTPGHIGSKSGFTNEAGETLVAVFNLKMTEFESRPIGIVLLGSTDRKKDADLIREYISESVFYTYLANTKTSASADDPENAAAAASVLPIFQIEN